MSDKTAQSVVWRFFRKSSDEKTVACLKCGKTLKFSSSTTGMINHVRTAHDKEKFELERSSSSSVNQGAMIRTASTALKTDESLILALCTSNVAFRFVKNEWFQKFCHLLNPEYQVLSPDSIKRRLSENSQKYIRDMKKELQYIDRCFITCDGWDGKYENVSLYAVFVYFIDSNYAKKKIFLGMKHAPGPATAACVGNVVTDIMREYDIDLSTVVGGICDAGSNLKAFLDRNLLYQYVRSISVKIIFQTFSLHCSAHSLALVVSSVSTKVQSVKDVLVKVNALAAHLSRSKTERQAFRSRSAALKINGPIPLPFCITRWAGCALLATAYLNHYQSISSLSRFQDFLLGQEEKELLEEYVFLMKPYIAAIAEAERDDNYCSEIVPQYASLMEFISGQNQKKAIVRFLKKETSDRFDAYLENDIALMATYADPRFAYLELLSKKSWEDVEKIVKLYCDSYQVTNQSDENLSPVPPEKRQKTSDSLFSRFIESKRRASTLESTKSEIIAYESMLVTGRPTSDSDPLLFWNSNRQRFPK
ncbi:hypothetical protein CAEBREN_19799 [Caenorhabditis brenneri]|uniref:BED-type domain-containing protein n=1 Tax=Caenorhabditis brenneri TaxID=135651 RepID=G0NLU5_CAEBE|nr:hypothetical protein CAEBREN_19799 [Caenorhabditis brenneri]